jgi:hypothetical protein
MYGLRVKFNDNADISDIDIEQVELIAWTRDIWFLYIRKTYIDINHSYYKIENINSNKSYNDLLDYIKTKYQLETNENPGWLILS